MSDNDSMLGRLAAGLKREFSLSNMASRASRRDALDVVRFDLEMWADYGDPALLEKAIERLRSTR